MQRIVVSIILSVLLMIVACSAFGRQSRSESGVTHRPVVVDTVPRSGDMSVDPSLSEIRVTFSDEMLTERMWSWVMESPETFPKTTGDPYYLDDNKTCVLPVALEPGKTYVIWINSAKFDGFRDVSNRPAAPYLLKFATQAQ